MSNNNISQQEKMDLWYQGKRGQNIKQCNDSKLLENYKICCESGYFVQAAKLRKEMYDRRYNTRPQFNLQPTKLPTDYFTTHNIIKISSDLLEYINNYINASGDSVDKYGLFLGQEGSTYFYGWDEKIDADLKINVSMGVAVFSGAGTFDYTRDLLEVLKLIRTELFNEQE